MLRVSVDCCFYKIFLFRHRHKGLFFFDGRFRPVPLQQNFIGVKSRSVMRQRLEMDESCYDIVTENLHNGYQVSGIDCCANVWYACICDVRV